MRKVKLIVILIFTSISLFAQDEQVSKGFNKENLFVGGNFGLSFGDYTFINLSPQLGYHFNRFLAAGIGINGQYININTRNYDGSLYSRTQQGVVGLNIFGRVYPFRQFMVQIQPEANYVFGQETFYQPEKQVFKLDAVIVPSVLAGGGFVLPSGRGELIISIFYDVLNRVNSPYGNRPIYNIGYNFGL